MQITHDAADLVRSGVLVAAALLPIINPAGSAPIFLSLTSGAGDADRHALARRIALNCLLLLAGATLIGSHVLDFFGLSLPAVRMGGGLLLMAGGWKLLTAEESTDQVRVSVSGIAARAFYPLTFPLTVGPGSISIAIALGAGFMHGGQVRWIQIAGAMLGIAATGCAIFLSYRFAANLTRALGRTGTTILLRMSAFILLCVGVQIMTEGVKEAFNLQGRRPPTRASQPG